MRPADLCPRRPPASAANGVFCAARREVDPFEVLGVPQDADIPAVRKAFHKLARKWHPDKNAGEKEEEAKRMMQKRWDDPSDKRRVRMIMVPAQDDARVVAPAAVCYSIGWEPHHGTCWRIVRLPRKT